MEADNIEEIVNNIPQSMFAKFITYMSEYEIPDL